MSARFVDGPAIGQSLLLKRTPIYLRVTRCGAKWDALDQPEDSPTPREEIFAYKREGESFRCHLNFGGGKGGFYSLASYQFVPSQPGEEELRDSKRWVQWVEARMIEGLNWLQEHGQISDLVVTIKDVAGSADLERMRAYFEAPFPRSEPVPVKTEQPTLFEFADTPRPVGVPD